MAKYPNELKYTKDHEWARLEDGNVRIGITYFAVEQLGDVTLVDLPEIGTRIEAEGHFGDIESVKAVSELFAPLSGDVLEVNADLEESPELINDAPYGDGWMMLIKPAHPEELSQLLDADAYEAFLGTLDG